MKTLICCLFGLTIGCAQGNCRSQNKVGTPSTSSAVLAATDSSALVEKMKVFKYDGSLQCGMGKASKIEETAKELKGIKIYSSFNKADGLMHIAQCGTPTGHAHVYEIERKDFAQAQKAGFKEWIWE